MVVIPRRKTFLNYCQGIEINSLQFSSWSHQVFDIFGRKIFSLFASLYIIIICILNWATLDFLYSGFFVFFRRAPHTCIRSLAYFIKHHFRKFSSGFYLKIYFIPLFNLLNIFKWLETIVVVFVRKFLSFLFVSKCLVDAFWKCID